MSLEENVNWNEDERREAVEELRKQHVRFIGITRFFVCVLSALFSAVFAYHLYREALAPGSHSIDQHVPNRMVLVTMKLAALASTAATAVGSYRKSVRSYNGKILYAAMVLALVPVALALSVVPFTYFTENVRHLDLPFGALVAVLFWRTTERTIFSSQLELDELKRMYLSGVKPRPPPPAGKSL